jgi:hypothetical protein
LIKRQGRLEKMAAKAARDSGPAAAVTAMGAIVLEVVAVVVADDSCRAEKSARFAWIRSTKSITRTFPGCAGTFQSAARSSRDESLAHALGISGQRRSLSSAHDTLLCCRSSPAERAANCTDR